MKALTQEERLELVEHCKFMLSEHVKYGGYSIDEDIYRIALAALTAEPVAAPEGWKLVPVEPTAEMLRAAQLRSELGSYATSELAGGYSLIDEMYEKMVSAAPRFNGGVE